MYTLKFWSCGDLVASWPCPADVAIHPLAKAILQAVDFYKRFGPCAVVVDDDNAAHVVYSWHPARVRA